MRPVLFIDFDGTLCHDRFWRSLEPALKTQVQEFLFGPASRELVGGWMRGRHTSEEINRMVADELSTDYEHLWDIFVKDCQSMSVDQGVLDRIARLKQQFVTILATDNMDCFDRFTVPALNLEIYFDSMVNSYNARMGKNDGSGRLFMDVLEKYGTSFYESVLIDNSKNTCEIFERLGGQSFFVTPEQPISYWLDILETAEDKIEIRS